MSQADDNRNRHRQIRNLLFAGIIWAAATAPECAVAHAIIVRTSPAQGGVAEATIGKVDVWYDAGIRDAFTALAVVSASGERVDKRDAAIDSADPAHVSVSVNPLTAGKYTVRYRALSADGHLVSGAWEFEVRP
jgi:methionine-rich copper-binding protein CopC